MVEFEPLPPALAAAIARERDRFGAHVVGIDPSDKMLMQASAKPAHPRVAFVKGKANAERRPWA